MTLFVFSLLVPQLLIGGATLAGFPETTAAGFADPGVPILMDEHVEKEKAKARATAKAKEDAERKATVSVTKDHVTASATAEAKAHAEAKAEGSAKAEAKAKEHKKKKAKHEAKAKAEKSAEEKAQDIAVSRAEHKASEKAEDVAEKLAERKAKDHATNEVKAILAKETAKTKATASQHPTESNLQGKQPIWPDAVLGLCLSSLLTWILIAAKGGVVAPEAASAREPEDQATPYVALATSAS